MPRVVNSFSKKMKKVSGAPARVRRGINYYLYNRYSKKARRIYRTPVRGSYIQIRIVSPGFGRQYFCLGYSAIAETIFSRDSPLFA